MQVGEFPNPTPGSPNLAMLPPALRTMVEASPLTPHSHHFATATELLAELKAKGEQIFKCVIACTPDELGKRACRMATLFFGTLCV